MFFSPYIVRCSDSSSVQVKIDTALPADISATHNAPLWQTNWDSPLLSDPSVQKFAMKTENGELVALAAYQISGRKAYVYILYAESAPASNPVLTKKAERKYCGIGAALIAFGIKFSIDNGCRGDVVFDAKTDELAKHYAEDFGAKRIPQRNERRPKTVYACRRGCLAAVLKILGRGGTGTWIKRTMHNM